MSERQQQESDDAADIRWREELLPHFQPVLERLEAGAAGPDCLSLAALERAAQGVALSPAEDVHLNACRRCAALRGAFERQRSSPARRPVRWRLPVAASLAVLLLLALFGRSHWPGQPPDIYTSLVQATERADQRLAQNDLQEQFSATHPMLFARDRRRGKEPDAGSPDGVAYLAGDSIDFRFPREIRSGEHAVLNILGKSPIPVLGGRSCQVPAPAAGWTAGEHDWSVRIPEGKRIGSGSFFVLGDGAEALVTRARRDLRAQPERLDRFYTLLGLQSHVAGHSGPGDPRNPKPDAER